MDRVEASGEQSSTDRVTRDHDEDDDSDHAYDDVVARSHAATAFYGVS